MKFDEKVRRMAELAQAENPKLDFNKLIDLFSSVLQRFLGGCPSPAETPRRVRRSGLLERGMARRLIQKEATAMDDQQMLRSAASLRDAMVKVAAESDDDEIKAVCSEVHEVSERL